MKREGKPVDDSGKASFASTLKLSRASAELLFVVRKNVEVLAALDGHRRFFNRHHVIGINMDGDGLTDETYR